MEKNTTKPATTITARCIATSPHVARIFSIVPQTTLGRYRSFRKRADAATSSKAQVHRPIDLDSAGDRRCSDALGVQLAIVVLNRLPRRRAALPAQTGL